MISLFYCCRCGMLIGHNAQLPVYKESKVYQLCPCTEGIWNPSMRHWGSKDKSIQDGLLVVWKEKRLLSDRLREWYENRKHKLSFVWLSSFT